MASHLTTFLLASFKVIAAREGNKQHPCDTAKAVFTHTHTHTLAKPDLEPELMLVQNASVFTITNVGSQFKFESVEERCVVILLDGYT